MLWANFFNEIINIMILVTRQDVESCIAHYIAFELISRIANIFLENVGIFPLKEAIEKPLHRRYAPIPFKKRSLWGKFVRCLYKFLHFFYASVYYYFTPFAVVLIPFFAAYYGINNFDSISMQTLFGVANDFGTVSSIAPYIQTS